MPHTAPSSDVQVALGGAAPGEIGRLLRQTHPATKAPIRLKDPDADRPGARAHPRAIDRHAIGDTRLGLRRNALPRLERAIGPDTNDTEVLTLASVGGEQSLIGAEGKARRHSAG